MATSPPLPAAVLRQALPLLLCPVLAGQEAARPFTLPDLGASGQVLPTQVALGGNVAAIVEVDGGTATVGAYTRRGGVWERDDSLVTGEIDAVAVQEGAAEIAVASGNEIEFHIDFFGGSWVELGSAQAITLPTDERVRSMALAGDRAAVVTATTGLVLNGGNPIRIFHKVSGTWSEEAVVEIETVDPIFGAGAAGIGGISFDGTTLAAVTSGGEKIGIFRRDLGGSGAWGEEKILTPPAGEGFSGSITLAGERLAVQVSDPQLTDNRIEVHTRSTGGTGNWGQVGRLITLPAGIATAELDASGDLLLVTGLGVEALGGSAPQAWFFGPGGGPGGWALESTVPLGNLNLGFALYAQLLTSQRAGLAGLSGPNAVFGFGGAGTGTAAVWAVDFFNRQDGVWFHNASKTGAGISNDFGSAVALGAGYLAVGNPRDTHAGSSSGSVALWTMDVRGVGSGQWLLPAGRIESPEATAGQRFGSAVAVAPEPSEGVLVPLSGSSATPDPVVVAVAAIGDNARGAVYVFDDEADGGYVRVDPGAMLGLDDGFGFSIALVTSGLLEDSYLVVGAPGDDTVGLNAGAAYVFRRNQGGTAAWGLSKKITRPAAVGGFQFGRSVAAGGTFGTTLAVARPGTSGDPGAVAIFPLSGSSTTPTEVIDAPAGSTGSFATAVALSGPLLAVGTSGSGALNGRVYLYPVPAGAATPVTVAAPSALGPSFGTRVAMDFPFLTVGAPDAGSGRGSVSQYLLTDLQMPTPTPVPTLLFSREGETGENLGSAVSSWKIYSVAGAPNSGAFGPDTGRVRIDRAGSYEIWAKSHGLLSDAWFDPEGDPDEDGQASLIEFMLDGDPLSASSLGVVDVELGTYTGGATPAPAVLWTPPLAAHSRIYADFRMAVSPDLGSWNNAAFRGGTDPGEARYYLIPSGATRRFYRLDPLYPWFGSAVGRESGIIPLSE